MLLKKLGIAFVLSSSVALPVATAQTIVIETVEVGDPKNEPIGIVPFTPEFPEVTGASELVGRVDYVYEMARYEITVEQYVTFLNVVDPTGTNLQQLWDPLMDPLVNPYRGQIKRDLSQSAGQRYSLAAPSWRNKPIGFIDFFRAARFINSIYNGQSVRTVIGQGVYQYECSPSLETESGAYNLFNQPVYGSYSQRGVVSGFVLPSQDEWIKAAYYSPNEVAFGRHYWRYPTRSDSAPSPAIADACGNVTNAGPGSGLVANYANGAVWCPAGCEAGSSAGCVPPDGNLGNLTDVGACRTPSPWGTFDQGGNVVEWTETVCAPVEGVPNPGNQSIWRQVHGGISIAADYQLWLSATGATDPYGQALGTVRAFGGFRPSMLPGANPNVSCAADLNHDGIVNGCDLGIVLNSWGVCN